MEQRYLDHARRCSLLFPALYEYLEVWRGSWELVGKEGGKLGGDWVYYYAMNTLQHLLLCCRCFYCGIHVLGTALVVVVAILICLGLFYRLLLLVGLLIEVVEQEVEEHSVGQGEADRPSWIAAVGVEQLSLMNEGAAELDLKRERTSTISYRSIHLYLSMAYHLQVGDVLLPPQILLHLRSEGGEEVVGVHDDVHERVDPANEGAMSAGIVLGGAPADHGHDSVMIHMQERHLTIVLAQHKEDRVEQFGYLGQIVNIHHACLTIRLGGA